MNIFESLGATKIIGDEEPICPSVFPDGSVSKETISWALIKLGFVNTPEIQFKYSTCLMIDGEAFNLSPSSAVKDGVELLLSPSSQRVGFYLCRYGGVGKAHLILPTEYSQIEGPGIEKAFEDAIEEISKVKKNLPIGTTASIREDSRYVWKKSFISWLFRKNGSWFFEGQQCDCVRLWLAGEGEFYFPEFKSDRKIPQTGCTSAT
jgi:hypothetical protein